MSPIDALLWIETHNHMTLGSDYTQGELQSIWRWPTEPIAEIQALGYERGEAMRLWSARPKDEAEWQTLANDMRRLRYHRTGLMPKDAIQP
jgi:hypothetical protein